MADKINKDQEQIVEDVEAEALQFNFGIKDGNVIVDFGKSIKWLGLPPLDALRFGELMIKTARQTLEGKTEASVEQT